jgi:glycosyltransferase EpsE
MSVGIYMPVYNVEKYILKSINSIKAQTFKDWQLVIMDDCSTDNTYNVIKTILDTTMYQDDRISLLKRDEHCGRIGQVKNECIALLGDHDYICHVGGDDYIIDDCFKIFTTYMDAHPEIGVCYGSFKCFDDEGHEWVFPHVANSGDYNPNVLLQYMCLFHMRFYRKSVIEQVGGYSNELTCAVDYDLALKVDEVSKIHRIKEPFTYYYRQHSQQISTRGRPEQDANAKKALEMALVRRKINGVVIGDRPPFSIKQSSFIWWKQ